jgi:ligand-binding sensor domain-containing protein
MRAISLIDFLMRDSRGFRWFCTQDGLSRFDGPQFITYQIGDETSPGVEAIYEARNGVYWIGTTGGLYRFNPDVLSTPKVARNGRPILNAEFVRNRRGNQFEDRRGNTWFASNGLF